MYEVYIKVGIAASLVILLNFGEEGGAVLTEAGGGYGGGEGIAGREVFSLFHRGIYAPDGGETGAQKCGFIGDFATQEQRGDALRPGAFHYGIG